MTLLCYGFAELTAVTTRSCSPTDPFPMIAVEKLTRWINLLGGTRVS